MEQYLGQWILLGFMFWLVWKAGQYTAIMGFKKILETIARDQKITVEQLLARAEKAMDQEVAKPPVNQTETWIEIERLGQQYYAYKSCGDFLAQGYSFTELFQRIKQQYPGENFRLPIKPQGFTDDESQLMVKTIYEIYGNDGPRVDK